MSKPSNPPTTARPIHSGIPNRTICLALFFAAVSGQAWAAEIVINDPALSAGYRVTSYVAGNTANRDVSIIGIYETHSNHSFNHHTQGTANVHIQYEPDEPFGTSGSSGDRRPMNPLVLVLSSYEPNRWVLDFQDNTVVSQIILNGYHPQVVENAGDIPVLNYSGLENGYLSACAYVWPADNQGCDTPALVAGVENLVGQPITAFSGVYRATDFTILGSPAPVTESSILPTDLNGDGAVDFGDLTMLLANWNRDGTALGNFVSPADTPIDFEDLTFLLASWTGPGQVDSPQAALGSEVVPEPSGLALAALGLLGMFGFARRRRLHVGR